MVEKRVTFTLNKLVRDRLPDSMRELGQDIELVSLEGKQHIDALIAKVGEELTELDPTSDTYLKELADLKQAMLDLIELTREPQQVEELRINDLEIRGGFLTGSYITDLHLMPDDPWIAYYRQDPVRFPESGEKL